jgi:3',5'-cyclic AMP phosphodiesterase CpdA
MGADHKNYDGYGFDGGNDNNNGNDKSEESFNFAATGDFGCSTNTQNTVASIEQKKPELVLPLGDLSYHSTADCWFDITSPLKGKMMVTLGYHDTQEGVAKMNQYLKSFQLDKPYYSYNYKKVHFLIMASQSPYTEGSEQYNFVKQDLEKSSQNKDIDWTVVTSYGPFYTSPTTHNAEKELRNIYHPLFEKYGVDLVLQAHNHNYQRTYPIAFNPDESSKPTVIKGSTTGYSANTDGTIFAIVGTGGQGFYPMQGQESYIAKQFDGKFGFLDIGISNGNPSSKLTGTFYDNKGNVQDNFTIEKDTKGKKGESNPNV